MLKEQAGYPSLSYQGFPHPTMLFLQRLLPSRAFVRLHGQYNDEKIMFNNLRKLSTMKCKV